MIALKIGDEFLDLGSDPQFAIEVYNPLFDFTKVPGTLVLPFTFKLSRHNARLLGHPQMRSTVGGRMRTVPGVQLYLMGTLWRIGSVQLLSGSNLAARANFVSDAADFDAEIAGQRLPELDLGTEPFNLAVQPAWPASNYALFPVHNPGFFDGKAPVFNNYVNYYEAGNFVLNGGPSLLEFGFTPYPYLVFILQKVFANFGYQVTGTWLQDPEVQKLVLYNTHDLNTGLGTYNTLEADIEWANHVPDITVGELLLALRNRFALGICIDANRKECRIVALREVVANLGYIDRTSKTLSGFEWESPTESGFELLQQPDSGERLVEARDPAWQSYLVGQGDTEISTASSSCFMLSGIDPQEPSRSWLVPDADQVTSKLNDYSGSGSRAALRLLFYHGLQTDSLGNTYPLGTAGNTSYSGATLGNYTLEWDGPYGLYQQWHRPWLDFLEAASVEKRLQQLTIADITTLDPTRKEMVDQLKYLWVSISVTATSQGLKPAKVVYKSTAL